MSTPTTRPPGVPQAATLVPGGASFDDLRELHENRADKRSYLRVSFPFVCFHPTGVMLTNVRHRALSINKRTWSMGRVMIWSNEARPVPDVWVWTLAEERAELSPAGAVA